jgi:phytoene dehydrogenase-like protein
MGMNETITVIGGGLAGLTAAIAAAERGARVTLHEAHATLGGRARTTEPPYLANDGTHAFYSDGAPWRWLAERGLHRPFVKPGLRELAAVRMRYQGRLRSTPPRILGPLATKRKLRAPVDRSFADWGTEQFGAEAVAAMSGFLGVVSYEADPGRLSAAFVWERLLRISAPRWPAVRYLNGGWGALVERMAARARELGVQIETGSRVGALPDAPVIVATTLEAAARLLGDEHLRWESGRSVLTDLGLEKHRSDPFLVSDLDEGGFLERYSLPDPGTAPAGHSLVQAQIPLHAGESKQEGLVRLERLCDTALPGWRERTVWRRTAVAQGRTGALDLPGTTWRDRPAIDRGGGVYLVGDCVAAPGLLSEVAMNSAIEAARLAVRAVSPAPTRTG